MRARDVLVGLGLSLAVGWSMMRALDVELRERPPDCATDLECACYALEVCEREGPWAPECEFPGLPDRAVALARAGACQ